uniref:Uncharacterized protein n=1 Tax=Oryza nivara TaxID=4536 RepID=A0A0E0HDJ1_ORYNI
MAACGSEGRRELASGGEREREELVGEGPRYLVSPRRSVREHIIGEGEGALRRKDSCPPCCTARETSPDAAALTRRRGATRRRGELITREWTKEDAATDDELWRGAWMMEDASAADVLRRGMDGGGCDRR